MAVIVIFFLVGPCQAQTLVGAGSSAAAPIYRAWADEYRRSGGPELRYDSIGSGAGMERIRTAAVDFGASDVISSRGDLERDGLVMVPTVVSAIVPVVQLPRVGNDTLRLTSALLAESFLGTLTRWDAPVIQALTPTVTLPPLPIQVIVRADKSGSTWNLADYLAGVSPAWQQRHGVSSRPNWPAAFVAVQGSADMSKTVRETPGAIGYVDYNFVVDDGLASVLLRNRDGAWVAAGVDSIRSAVLNSDWHAKGDFFARLNDRAGATSWPLTMGTFVAVPRVASDPAATSRALQFVTWGYLHGDGTARRTRFVPLPARVQASAYRLIATVVDRQGLSIGAQALTGAMRR